MIVSSLLFEIYLECSTKCWLRSRGEPVAGNNFAEWIRAQNETYFQDGLNRLLATLPESDRAITPRISERPEDATWRFAIDVTCGRMIWNRACRLWKECLQNDETGPPGARLGHPLSIQICQ